MGTRRRKRAIRKTRKTKGGVWTPNKNKSVKRRHNLLRYTSNSKTKSNQAVEALHKYIEATQKEDKSVDTITFKDVLQAITPITQKDAINVMAYTSYVEKKCEELIETKLKAIMAKKEDTDLMHRQFKKAIFLANRAQMRVQEAAHIASIGRLSNSLINDTNAKLIEEWNKGTMGQQALLELGYKNKPEADKIIQNMTTINEEILRLRYELTKQVVEIFKTKLDYTLIFYYDIPHKKSVYGVRYTAQAELADHNTFVDRTRTTINKIIKGLDGIKPVDQLIASITENVYDMLLDASAKYTHIQKGSDLKIAKAELQDLYHRRERMQLNRLHFKILTTYTPGLGSELSKKRVYDDEYRRIELNIGDKLKEIQALEGK